MWKMIASELPFHRRRISGGSVTLPYSILLLLHFKLQFIIPS